jgi:membrane AbrB-like protein
MMVVGTIPFIVRALHAQAALPPFVPAATEVHYPGLALLALATSLGALVLKRRAVPNAWVIGPLIVALLLTAAGIHLSRLPEWAIRAGQLLIGVSLGTRFTPTFVHTAPRFLASVAACTAGVLLLASAFALVLARVTGMHWATAVLATSPGGIAEMALTARVLNLGVPVVTAFHVTRLVVVVLTIGPAYRLLMRKA